MEKSGFRYIYGPVPSRRLGRSLGVDLVPFKICTYDCVYCQLGRTTKKTLERREYVPIREALTELKLKLRDIPPPDFISLAGSGEPTLNSEIGVMIREIKKITDIPVAVITNGSLLGVPKVKEALMAADLILPSLDAGDAEMFERVNRPHPGIDFDGMVRGIAEFTRDFPGKVFLEVFLLDGITGTFEEVRKIAARAAEIHPAKVQLNSVARPPSEDRARPVSLQRLLALRSIFSEETEIICDQGRSDSRSTVLNNRSVEDILALLDRRPCTLDDIVRGLGVNPSEAVKEVSCLLSMGKIEGERTGALLYFKRKS
jgi:wyosine [tRNA(Phe)-imidazoG37] synthetase (radical SAM superfamily)